MNLLFVEIDGLDCIADHQLRLDEVKRLKHGPSPSSYLQHLYDVTLMALDKPVQGARDALDFLVDHKWRIVFLSQRIRTREVYRVTIDWLKEHGFDDYSYELVLRERQFSGLSIAEWKVMKVWWYTQEPISPYREIILVEPRPHIREQVREQWDKFSDKPLHIYSGLTDFTCHQLQHEQERKRPSYYPGATLVPPVLTALKGGEEASHTPSETERAHGDVAPFSPNNEQTLPSSSPIAESINEHREEDQVSRYDAELPQSIITEQGEEERDEGSESDDHFFEESPQDDVGVQERDESDTSPILAENADEDEETQDEVIPRPRKQRTVKSSSSDELVDERLSVKKRTKRAQRERQVIRSAKEAVLSYGSED